MRDRVITLTEGEQRIARFLARERHDRARHAGIPDRKMGPQSAEETDLEGIGAELAYCKLANLWPDLSYGHRPDADALTHYGEGVDVKATRYASGKLIVAKWKQHKSAGRYALMVGRFPTYRYAGELPAYKVFQDRNLTDLGHGELYAIDQRDLEVPESMHV